jgi:hypothetical protein
MKLKVRQWLRGLGAAIIGGGSSAVASGLTTMGFAPDKFNLNSLEGLKHIAVLTIANFVFSAFLSGMFFLRMNPLPPEENENK